MLSNADLPSELAAPEWVEKPVDTQMQEGQPGYLHCHTQATPQPQVTWYRNFAPLSAEVSFFTPRCFNVL